MHSPVEGAEDRLDETIPQKDAESMVQMKERGLTVVEIGDVATQPEWLKVAGIFAEMMRSNVPDEVFQEALRQRALFREQTGEASSP